MAVKRKGTKEAFVKLYPPEMWLCFCQYMRWFIPLTCNIGCVERDRYFRSASRFIGTPPVFNPCAQFTKNCLRLVTGSLVYIITTLCYQLPLINIDTFGYCWLQAGQLVVPISTTEPWVRDDFSLNPLSCADVLQFLCGIYLIIISSIHDKKTYIYIRNK